VRSRGVNWIGDPGPFRYDRSAMRNAVKSRAMHSALSIVGARNSIAGGVFTLSSTDGRDSSCVRDLGYSMVTLTRCVTYFRNQDYFLVQDRVIDRRKARSRPLKVVQRWKVPPKIAVKTSQSGSGARGFTLTSGDASMSLFADEKANFSFQRARPSGTAGWFTVQYASMEAGSMLSRSVVINGDEDLTMTTALVPSNGNRGLLPLDTLLRP
jgi:hypothetical protein